MTHGHAPSKTKVKIISMPSINAIIILCPSAREKKKSYIEKLTLKFKNLNLKIHLNSKI